MTAAAVKEMNRLRVPLAVVTAVLSAIYLVLGLLPEPPGAVARISDLAVHAAGYALLAFLAAACAAAFLAARPALLGALYAISHGVLLELLQLAVPARTAELKDVAVDAVAAILAVVPWLWWRR